MVWWGKGRKKLERVRNFILCPHKWRVVPYRLMLS